jgi:DNA (cytosine-5)-methyltransferase 1
MSLRSGELFAGVGGLGMAVDEVFGSEPAWFAEFDAAPSKVLAHRYPHVPNFGDVTQLRDAPKVDILAGGFPCQDVSLAGARRGMKDGTRSGLWSEYARIIDEVRPDWVVIENVRGLISARADSEVEPCPWCVGDGDDEYHLRALDAVLADLSRLGFDAEWTGLRAADIGAPHGRFRFFILAWPNERTLPDSPGGGRNGWAREPIREQIERTTSAGSGGESRALTLLPTPVAQPSGNTPEDHLRKKPGREVVTDLAIIAENDLIRTGGRLLPTPVVTDAKGARNATSGRREGSEHHSGTTLTDAVTLMPTPRATRGGSATEMAYAMGGERSDDERPQGVVVPGTDWGPYAAAVKRWEVGTGRSAPSPVRNDGKGGKPRLNPELPEWMMGWPAGWVTDMAIGLTRAEQLKAAGNGVVPQQAAAALRILLARPGVPAIREEQTA